MDHLTRMLEMLAKEPATSRHLQQRMGLSQPTLSRLVEQAGERIHRIGRGRATRYAAVDRVFGERYSLPLYAVDRAGVTERIATLQAMKHGSYHVTAERPWFWLLGAALNGYFKSLPYYLHDLRPRGFLGRQFARTWAINVDGPLDPDAWDSRQLGQFLLRHGDELPGCLVLGEAAVQRVHQRPVAPVEDRDAEYPRIAALASTDQAPGCLAAGEQPKFAVCHKDAGHVIVKYSPAGTSAEAKRWRDLLRAEHLALRSVDRQGIPSATTELYPCGERLFLECRRFDRRGPAGRVLALSMATVDVEYVGRGHGWTEIAQALHDRGLLDRDSLRHIAWLECFGAWIGNTDMHPGNLSLTVAEDHFALLPAYDMLPMALAPVRGELPTIELRPPLRRPQYEDLWHGAGVAAIDYWARLADDPAFDSSLRTRARKHAQSWAQLIYPGH